MGDKRLRERVRVLEIRMGKLEQALHLMWNEVPREARQAIMEEMKGDNGGDEAQGTEGKAGSIGTGSG